ARGAHDPRAPRAEADRDPDRHRVRAGIRLDARIRGGHRDDLLLARRRQADHRLDHLARPAGDGRLPDPGGAAVRHDQSRRRPRLRAARSAPAPRALHMNDAIRRFWSEFRENPVAVVALVVVVVMIAAALLAPLIAPQNPYDIA